MDLKAPDVVLIADGGGLAAAVLSPIHGAEPVARLLARADQAPATFETTTVWLNGPPAGVEAKASDAHERDRVDDGGDGLDGLVGRRREPRGRRRRPAGRR
jgi:hypothetical protein